MQGQTFHFPPFELVSDVDLLLRDGATVQIEPRAVQVLRYLIRNRDRVVPKDELLDQVWADVFTTDAVLNSRLANRPALGGRRCAVRPDFPARLRFIGPRAKVQADNGLKTAERRENVGKRAPANGEINARPTTTASRARAELSMLRAEYGA